MKSLLQNLLKHKELSFCPHFSSKKPVLISYVSGMDSLKVQKHPWNATRYLSLERNWTLCREGQSKSSIWFVTSIFRGVPLALCKCIHQDPERNATIQMSVKYENLKMFIPTQTNSTKNHSSICLTQSGVLKCSLNLCLYELGRWKYSKDAATVIIIVSTTQILLKGNGTSFCRYSFLWNKYPRDRDPFWNSLMEALESNLY